MKKGTNDQVVSKHIVAFGNRTLVECRLGLGNSYRRYRNGRRTSITQVPGARQIQSPILTEFAGIPERDGGLLELPPPEIPVIASCSLRHALRVTSNTTVSVVCLSAACNFCTTSNPLCRATDVRCQ